MKNSSNKPLIRRTTIDLSAIQRARRSIVLPICNDLPICNARGSNAVLGLVFKGVARGMMGKMTDHRRERVRVAANIYDWHSSTR
jgi:hypothetical protein